MLLCCQVGGFDGASGLSSTEVLDTRVGNWRGLASMATRRSSVGVAVLQGKIYAVRTHQTTTNNIVFSASLKL